VTQQILKDDFLGQACAAKNSMRNLSGAGDALERGG